MKKSTTRRFPRITNGWLKLLGTAIIVISSLVVNHISCHTTYRYASKDIEVYFAPEHPCIDRIVDKIRSAQKLILVQAYVITSKKIVDALIQAHQNKVDVQLLIDKNTQSSKGSKIGLMLQHGIPIIVDKTVGAAHNKVMIIDNEYVITGSFNWTHSAQNRNAENIIIIKGKAINQKFKNNWYTRAASGELLKPTYNH